MHNAIADFPVVTILWGLNGEGNSETRWLENDLRQLGTTSQMMQPGDGFELDGMTIQAVDMGETVRSLVIRSGNFELYIPDGMAIDKISKTVPSSAILWLSVEQSQDSSLSTWKVNCPALTLSAVGAPSDWTCW